MRRQSTMPCRRPLSIHCLRWVSPQFAMYDARHGFCERLLESGVEHLTVAELMGHANGRMVATTYQHLTKAHAHLKDALKKVSDAST